MNKENRYKTAAELDKELEKDSNYRILIQEKENERKNLELILSKDEEPLVNELNLIGIDIKSVWDLVNSKKSYPDAISILIRHLQFPYLEQNKEGIIRALAVKEAKNKANKALLMEYFKNANSSFHFLWAIGNTLNVIATQSDLDEIIKIVLDKKNGKTREMFIAALGKMKSTKSEDVLIELLNDQEVVIYAIKALGRIKSFKAKYIIQRYLNDVNSATRIAAEKALKMIENKKL